MPIRQWLARIAYIAAACVAWLPQPAVHAADFLDPQDAFRFSATVTDGGKTVEAHFRIADGYYLYYERFGFAARGGVRLGTPQYPPGKIKFDETFNKEVVTYRGDVTVKLPVQSGNGEFMLTASLQGCADQGLCYPPEQRNVRILLGDPNEQSMPGAGLAPVAPMAATPSDPGRIDAALESRSLLTVLPIFFVLGLLLSFTPCVLPMLPILSSIIVAESGPKRDEGEHGLTKARGFVLALAYSLGMAVVYTALGVAAGLAGEGLAAALQQPWVLILFAVALVVLALSMFGFYDLQLPSSWQTSLAKTSGRMRGGRLGGVFAMGALSALIVGPCVASPLAGALLYISQTRDVLIGGSALFAMAAGMSVPLLMVGVSAGSLLPRAGRWMESVKRLFGVLLIVVALWIISPVIPVWSQMLAWGALFVVSAVYLLVFKTPRDQRGSWSPVLKSIALLLVAIGTLHIIDALRLDPLVSGRGTADANPLRWGRVESVDQLDATLARADGKSVVLEFYADWCVSCKEMERFTFTDPDVASRLAGFTLLRVDVTANNAQDRALLKRFRLFGPPATIFFDGQGREVPDTRVIGFESASRVLTMLTRVGHS